MLSHSIVNTDKYNIMVFLSTLTYSQYAIPELVQTLLAFATVLELRMKRSPDYTSFELSHGYEADNDTLFEVAKIRGRTLHSCPESSLPRFPYESFSDADDRRRERHQAAAEECFSRFANALICQWPEEDVRDP